MNKAKLKHLPANLFLSLMVLGSALFFLPVLFPGISNAAWVAISFYIYATDAMHETSHD